MTSNHINGERPLLPIVLPEGRSQRLSSILLFLGFRAPDDKLLHQVYRHVLLGQTAFLRGRPLLFITGYSHCLPAEGELQGKRTSSYSFEAGQLAIVCVRVTA